MRELHVSEITQSVRDLCIEANQILPKSLEARITAAPSGEKNPLCREVLTDLKRNLDAAREMNIPICQDTGMAVVFVELGQDVHLVGGSLQDAVNRGVAAGYIDGYLRCSVVEDPLRRKNTGDNTPAVLHLSMTEGDRVKITVAPKGFGSENMSAVRMFTPSASPDDLVQFVTDTVLKAGSNPCPPVVLGVGIGGDFELCAYLAKKALCRDVDCRHPDPFYAELEQKMLDACNQTGVGAQGFGGDVTALAVNIETYPTHIAGLPVAVNVGCHVTRHASILL